MQRWPLEEFLLGSQNRKEAKGACVRKIGAKGLQRAKKKKKKGIRIHSSCFTVGAVWSGHCCSYLYGRHCFNEELLTALTETLIVKDHKQFERDNSLIVYEEIERTECQGSCHVNKFKNC